MPSSEEASEVSTSRQPRSSAESASELRRSTLLSAASITSCAMFALKFPFSLEPATSALCHGSRTVQTPRTAWKNPSQAYIPGHWHEDSCARDRMRIRPQASCGRSTWAAFLAAGALERPGLLARLPSCRSSCRPCAGTCFGGGLGGEPAAAGLGLGGLGGLVQVQGVSTAPSTFFTATSSFSPASLVMAVALSRRSLRVSLTLA